MEDDSSMFVRPTMKDDRTDLKEQSLTAVTSENAMLKSLGEDNAEEFTNMLKDPTKTKHAIDLVFKMRLSTFYNIRILTFWFLLSMEGESVVDPQLEDVDEMFIYITEGLDDETIKNTQKHIVSMATSPSHFWLLALKKFWDDNMVKGLYKTFKRNTHSLERLNTVIVDYHRLHKPYAALKDNVSETIVPSKWFRTVLYPFFGGEPEGMFDDSPMSYEETLRNVFSNYRE